MGHPPGMVGQAPGIEGQPQPGQPPQPAAGLLAPQPHGMQPAWIPCRWEAVQGEAIQGARQVIFVGF